MVPHPAACGRPRPGFVAATSEPAGTSDQRALLAAALIYPAWVAYGSLFPLAGWRDEGLPPFAFLYAGWPPYWTAFDLAVNVLLYLPLGYLWYAVLRRRLGTAGALLASVLAAAALSLLVETAQGWLPSRVSSNIDFLCNGTGALLGASLAARFHPAWSGRFSAMLGAIGRPAGEVRVGIALLATWALVQLSPENTLFATGPGGFGLGNGYPTIEPTTRVRIEAAAVALHGSAVALMAADLMSGTRIQVLGRLLLGSLLIFSAKAVAMSIALGFGRAFDWLSTGTQWGVLAGFLAVPLALLVPPRGRAALALATLAGGALALAVLPPSPYVPSPAIGLLGSPVRNFVGATEWMTMAWPVLAIAYLFWQLARSRMASTASTREN